MTPAIALRPPQIRLYEDEGCIDGFAGGGGTSEGIEMAIGRGPDVAINHDPIALALHKVNHPDTHHITSNIRTVDYRLVLRPGTRCGFAWFSPDCTHFSKARGGKPFRDRHKARRIRGLAWEAVRCAKQLGEHQPRIIFLENVEEWLTWGQFPRWLRALRALGYVVEWRQLRACDFGAPTTRKRLFVIARCDGKPIVWPEPTHGPTRDLPHRTAAECIDFSLPVPSIFMTQRQAKRWAVANGVETPKRPLARATLRRIARGVVRFVLESPEPFIVRYNSENSDGSMRGQRLDEPLGTLDTSNRFALVTPFLAKHLTGSIGSDLARPMHTIVAAGVTQSLVTPMLVRISHGEFDKNGKKRGKGEHDITEPLPTQTTSNDFALVAPTLINTRNGERKGQAPRALDIAEPMRTITAVGSQGALVAAFLAKHNGGHEATGQRLKRPADTITVRENKALITSHLVKLRGEPDTHPNSTSQDLREPLPTVTAQGNHYAEVRAFLVKYYGTNKDGRPLTAPCDTITTKDRFALCTVTIAGEEYAIVDIGMRMLAPRELFNAQGFPRDYHIDTVWERTELGLDVERRLTKRDKTRLCGNAVPPHLAAALIGANLEATR